MSKYTGKLIESTPFMAGMTALGGFCNAYTGMTRGGVFANAHTANMTRMAIAAATLDWATAFNALVPVLGCLAGATLCEFVREERPGKTNWLERDWHHRAVLMVMLSLFIVGFIPSTVPHAIVNAFMSFVTGFQLDIFRTWWGGAHNTTICTGNLRNLAQHIHDAVRRTTPDAGKKMCAYIFLVPSFCLGAFICAWLCQIFGVRASWFGALFLLGGLVWMYLDEKKAA